MKKALFIILTLCIGMIATQCGKKPESPAPDPSANQTGNNSNDDDKDDNEDTNPSNNGSNSISCQSITDNQIKIDNEVFVRDMVTANQYIHICMKHDFVQSGVPFINHQRFLYFKDGDFVNNPGISIVLGHVPEPGTTVSYVLDEGFWNILGSKIPSTGKAMIRLNSYLSRGDKSTQDWGTYEGSGAIEAMADANGDITLNFNDVTLLTAFNPGDEKLVICGKNILCQK